MRNVALIIIVAGALRNVALITSHTKNSSLVANPSCILIPKLSSMSFVQLCAGRPLPLLPNCCDTYYGQSISVSETRPGDVFSIAWLLCTSRLIQLIDAKIYNSTRYRNSGALSLLLLTLLREFSKIVTNHNICIQVRWILESNSLLFQLAIWHVQMTKCFLLCWTCIKSLIVPEISFLGISDWLSVRYVNMPLIARSLRRPLNTGKMLSALVAWTPMVVQTRLKLPWSSLIYMSLITISVQLLFVHPSRFLIQFDIIHTTYVVESKSNCK